MSLKTYRQKRDFKKTPEPSGKKITKPQSSYSFTIQKHAASHLHYDFRLELNGVLISWAVPKGPCLDPAVKRLAMHVEDHPIEYGTFEGIIPEGQYGGGTVMLWDRGTWLPDDENPSKAYSNGNLTFSLMGKKLKGKWKLIRINKNDKTWLLIKKTDNFSKPLSDYDITIKRPNSILSKHSIDQIAKNYQHVWGSKESEKKNSKKKERKIKRVLPKIKIDLTPAAFPRETSPQLATLVDQPPIEKNWLHEIKLDGYRFIAIKKEGKTKLFTRNNNDWSGKFKKIIEEIDKIPIGNLILDGEVVVLDENQHSNFQLLQNSLKENNSEFTYYVFDILYYDKYNLMQLPLLERKSILKQIIPYTSESLIRYSDHIIGSGKAIFKKACQLGLEGIISKDSTSPYIQKRTKNWLKVKCTKRQEFIIGGFLLSDKAKRNTFRSLMLGTYNKKQELVYNGNVGTGFTYNSLQEIYKLLIKNKIQTNPFSSKPPNSKIAIWVKPVLVAEVEFTEWTHDNTLRHPSFKGIRKDKSPKAIKKEEVMPVKTITKNKKSSDNPLPYKLTHPDKILYSEDKVTKKDIAEYYYSIQKWILPYIVNRPLSIVRCPNSYKECFFQKHITVGTPPALYGKMIKEKEGRSKCIYIKDGEGLLALAQLGCLEIHPWGSTIMEVEYPDMMIFDLDPAPDVPWKEVVKGAFTIKKHLDELKIKSFVKTTGGKGLHVVFPIKPEFKWQEIKNFSHAFVDLIVAQNPKSYVDVMTKSKRVGKIFIDYLRNQRGATAVAAYSTRARLHVPVSTPLAWEELTHHFDDTFFTLKSLPKRLHDLKMDPWKEFFKIKQSIKIDKLK